jgi:2',3'-cyclic-nucleotide 2'-phosphodiesterase/3'-nucleotidase
MQHFKSEFYLVRNFVQQRIGQFISGVDITDAYFGCSAYIDLIQKLQLRISGADISFCAPLFFNISIAAGEVHVSDLFNLYRFEDKLYTLKLRGSEIKNYLEMSYANWTNQMHSPDDNMLLLSPMKSNPDRMGFTNFIFNFDSAAGICYEVDLRQPQGKKVKIKNMADGSSFDPDHYYTVAMTAYRVNGGGELLTKGAGIPHEELRSRIVFESKRDQRYYLTKEIERLGTVDPQPFNNWRFVPEEWAKPAIERDRRLIFGD